MHRQQLIPSHLRIRWSGANCPKSISPTTSIAQFALLKVAVCRMDCAVEPAPRCGGRTLDEPICGVSGGPKTHKNGGQARFFEQQAGKLIYSSGQMNRSAIVELLAARFSQLTQRDADFAVTTILDAMSDAMARGHRIEIRGFGSFSVMNRAPRVGRNPRSGEPVDILEKRMPHFKPGKALRAAPSHR